MFVAEMPGDARTVDGDAAGVGEAGADAVALAAGVPDGGGDWLAPHAVDTTAEMSSAVARVIPVKPPAE
jgi:hypothetical protein